MGTYMPVATANTTTYTGYITAGSGSYTIVRQDEVWDAWRNMTTGTGTGTITIPMQYEMVWNEWVTDDERRRRTEEMQQQRRDLMQQERERRSRDELERAQRLEQLEAAHQRGLELFKMLLTPEQRQELARDLRVTVRGNAGGLYQIDCHGRSVHGNIHATDEHGCRLGNLCVAPGMRDRLDDGRLRTMPTSDGWVGQLLSIRHNEEELLAKANWSFQQQCRHPEVPVIGQAA